LDRLYAVFFYIINR